MTNLSNLKIFSLVLIALVSAQQAFASDQSIGEKTYQQACAMCHTSGVAGSPVLGDKNAWSERVKKGNETLYNSANNGLGAMPAKGGQAQLSDEDVIAAVDYMLLALEQEGLADKANNSQDLIPVALTADQELGKAIAYDRNKGNCLACHQIMDAEFPGNSAPALSNMQARYPDIAVLREQIADPTISNPESIMPPYGRHEILTAEELDLVTDFINAL